MSHFRLAMITRCPPMLAIAFAWLMAAMPVHAQELYRYQDAQGNPVISSTLSDEAIQNGYSVLDSNGRTLKKVPPAPTREELDQKARKQAQQSAAQQAAEQRRKADQILLRTYSSPNDAVRALHRKLRELENIISLKEGNVAVLQDQLQSEQTKAANAERAGRKVPQSVMQKMQNLHQQIDSVKQDITDQRTNINQIKQSYTRKINRLEQITGKRRTLPIDLPRQSQTDKKTGQ